MGLTTATSRLAQLGGNLIVIAILAVGCGDGSSGPTTATETTSLTPAERTSPPEQPPGVTPTPEAPEPDVHDAAARHLDALRDGDVTSLYSQMAPDGSSHIGSIGFHECHRDQPTPNISDYRLVEAVDDPEFRISYGPRVQAVVVNVTIDGSSRLLVLHEQLSEYLGRLEWRWMPTGAVLFFTYSTAPGFTYDAYHNRYEDGSCPTMTEAMLSRELPARAPVRLRDPEGHERPHLVSRGGAPLYLSPYDELCVEECTNALEPYFLSGPEELYVPHGFENSLTIVTQPDGRRQLALDGHLLYQRRAVPSFGSIGGPPEIPFGWELAR